MRGIIIGCFCVHYSNLKAQSSQADSSFYSEALSSAISAYDSLNKGLNAAIYNGVEQLGYVYTIKGTPYFGPKGWQKATVLYDGVLYRNVSVKYDMVKDLLLVAHPNGYTVLSLFSPRVDSFSFAGHRFYYLNRKDIPAGFYELLKEGKVSIVAKRARKINENVFSPDRGEQFESEDEFFAVRDGNYHLIKTEKEMLALFPGQQKEAHRYLKSGKIKFRKNPEEAILRLAEYYNR
ncbi:MAG: hypothetical protein ACJ75B_01870 [Flavisolibacter sp.]